MTPGPIGQPVSRIDGPQKVTGAATYAAEFDVRGQVHAAIVRSTIANGRIAAINTSNAQRAAGVLAVMYAPRRAQAALSTTQSGCRSGRRRTAACAPG